MTGPEAHTIKPLPFLFHWQLYAIQPRNFSNLEMNPRLHEPLETALPHALT